MPFHNAENSGKFLARHFRAVEQGFNIAAQDRQWRAQFVRNVGDKIPPYLIDLLELSDVVKQNHCSRDLACVVPRCDSVELNLRPVQGQLAANWSTTSQSILNDPIERCIADNLQQSRPFRNLRQSE